MPSPRNWSRAAWMFFVRRFSPASRTSSTFFAVSAAALPIISRPAAIKLDRPVDLSTSAPSATSPVFKTSKPCEMVGFVLAKVASISRLPFSKAEKTRSAVSLPSSPRRFSSPTPTPNSRAMRRASGGAPSRTLLSSAGRRLAPRRRTLSGAGQATDGSLLPKSVPSSG